MTQPIETFKRFPELRALFNRVQSVRPTVEDVREDVQGRLRETLRQFYRWVEPGDFAALGDTLGWSAWLLVDGRLAAFDPDAYLAHLAGGGGAGGVAFVTLDGEEQHVEVTGATRVLLVNNMLAPDVQEIARDAALREIHSENGMDAGPSRSEDGTDR